MKGTTILITGNNAATTGRLQYQLNKNAEWDVIAAVSAEKAIELLHRHPLDVVVLTDNADSADAKKLMALFTRQLPGVLLLSYDPAGNTDLFDQVRDALDQRNRKLQHNYSFNDDVFHGFHAS